MCSLSKILLQALQHLLSLLAVGLLGLSLTDNVMSSSGVGSGQGFH